MRESYVRAAVVAVLLLTMGVTAPEPELAAAPVTTTTAPAPAMTHYLDPTNGWSIDYPVDWQVDASNPASVKMRDNAVQAMVNVHVVPTTLPLPAVVDQLLATQEQVHNRKGQAWTLTSRQPTALPDGTPAVDVLVEVGPGGRSHQLYVVNGAKAFAVNAETYATSWDAYSPDFSQMLSSFRPG